MSLLRNAAYFYFTQQLHPSTRSFLQCVGRILPVVDQSRKVEPRSQRKRMSRKAFILSVRLIQVDEVCTLITRSNNGPLEESRVCSELLLSTRSFSCCCWCYGCRSPLVRIIIRLESAIVAVDAETAKRRQDVVCNLVPQLQQSMRRCR